MKLNNGDKAFCNARLASYYPEVKINHQELIRGSVAAFSRGNRQNKKLF